MKVSHNSFCICGHLKSNHNNYHCEICGDAMDELFDEAFEKAFAKAYHKFKLDNLKYLEQLSESKS